MKSKPVAPAAVSLSTTALGVPCLTLRENTERLITVEQGTNTMVGRDVQAIRSGVAEILAAIAHPDFRAELRRDLQRIRNY